MLFDALKKSWNDRFCHWFKVYNLHMHPKFLPVMKRYLQNGLEKEKRYNKVCHACKWTCPWWLLVLIPLHRPPRITNWIEMGFWCIVITIYGNISNSKMDPAFCPRRKWYDKIDLLSVKQFLELEWLHIYLSIILVLFIDLCATHGWKWQMSAELLIR